MVPQGELGSPEKYGSWGSPDLCARARGNATAFQLAGRPWAQLGSQPGALVLDAGPPRGDFRFPSVRRVNTESGPSFPPRQRLWHALFPVLNPSSTVTFSEAGEGREGSGASFSRGINAALAGQGSALCVERDLGLASEKNFITNKPQSKSPDYGRKGAPHEP